MIEFSNFAKVDVRVGRILTAVFHAEARKPA